MPTPSSPAAPTSILAELASDSSVSPKSPLSLPSSDLSLDELFSLEADELTEDAITRIVTILRASRAQFLSAEKPAKSSSKKASQPSILSGALALPGLPAPVLKKP